MKSFRSVTLTGIWLRNTEFGDSILSEDEFALSDRFSTLILPSRIFFFSENFLQT